MGEKKGEIQRERLNLTLWSWYTYYRWFLKDYVEITGVENIPDDKGFIFASNHLSFADAAKIIPTLYLRTGRVVPYVARIVPFTLKWEEMKEILEFH